MSEDCGERLERTMGEDGDDYEGDRGYSSSSMPGRSSEATRRAAPNEPSTNFSVKLHSFCFSFAKKCFLELVIVFIVSGILRTFPPTWVFFYDQRQMASPAIL